ncbi:MAG: response regulator [Hyphomonadaceae bacterium]
MAEREKLHVLVVEDEALVAMLVEDMLAELGHKTVAVVGRLDQALRAVEEGAFDLAVLDVNLGGGQLSYPIAEKIVARGVPFLFATGYGVAGLSRDWAHVPTIQKPFQLDDLARAIDAALANAN